MTSVSHEPTTSMRGRSRWSELLGITEMWASLAIMMMWLAVLFDAVYGSDMASTTVGGTSTTAPSAIAVALFAFLGTWAVAKYGFRHDKND
jgi:multisubunit Na+/H+ antiporter MnhF subunit